MLKIEKKFIEFVEKHLLIFQLVLVTAIALYLRRTLIWWNAENIGAYFDLHENRTQSYLFSLVVRAVQYLPMLPLHSIKWIAIFADFGAAVLCLLLVREKREDRLLQIFCYTFCLFSPVMILRGAAWAQIDSAAVMLFLLGWLLYDKGKKAVAWGLMLLSALLYPCMLLFVFGFLYYQGKEEERTQRVAVGSSFVIIWLILSGVLALPFGHEFAEGISNGIAWLSYDPVTGLYPVTGVDWLLNILTVLGLPASVIGGIVLVRQHKVSCFWVMLGHLLIILLYGGKMFAGL